MKLGISTPNNGKPIVLSFAEKHGHIKYMGYSDGWMHKENGCNGTLSANGKPGHFDCRKCGTAFKKQGMLASQIETRDARAKDLLPTVSLEHRDDSIGLLRFVVRSQSRPKAYLVMRDNHGNWSCCCEDYLKHKKYDLWKCKHIISANLFWENEQKSKERTVNNRPSLPIRPSLICTGTQDEFELANKLDEKQIVHGDDGVLAYEINGKITISFCGTMELATRMGITISDIQTRQAYHLSVATAKAHNPATGNTQAGAHSAPKLLSGLRPNPNAEKVAIGLAKRNACLKVIPEVTIYNFANKHAQKPPFDYLEAFYACQKVYTDKGLGDFHVSSVVKELYPDKPPAELGRDEWVEVYKACQKHADELDKNPDIERSKSYWAKTTDGDVVLVTETGDNTPAPICEFYDNGKCNRVLVRHPYLNIGHCHQRVGCGGNTNSDACKQMAKRFPYSFGIITDEYKARYYKDGKFDPEWWRRGVDETMANLKNMTVEEYRAMKYDGVNGDAVKYYDDEGNICKDRFNEMGRA